MKADIPKEHRPQTECEGCPFRGPRVGSKCNPEAETVYVAESPGSVERFTGIPLTGPSGKIFHTYVPNDNSVYILNSMECCPPGKLKDEKRMVAAAYCCHDNLINKIKAHPRKLIVAMGNSALRSLTGNYGLKITKERGRLIPSDLSELGILPVVHIAALMRGTGNFRQWCEDIQYSQDLARGVPPKEHLKAEVEFVPTKVTRRYMDYLFTQMTWKNPNLSCDIETSSLFHYNGRILSIGITPDNDKSISYCFRPSHLRLLKKYLEDTKINWCWHGGKFDIKFLRTAGINARVDDDTMLMSYALDESGGIHDLEQVAKDVLGAPDYKYMIQPYLPNNKTSYEVIPFPVLGEYQAIDTSNTAQLRPILRNRVARDPKLEKLYTQTLIPANDCLAQMEMNGIFVDQERIHENETYFKAQLKTVEDEIDELLGFHINPGSWQQVQPVLFKYYKFRDRRKGSTDAKTLETIAKETDGHPFILAMQKHRHESKMYGTYVKGLLRWITPDGRIHSSFLIHGTRTGRLASRDPNIQNIPRLAQLRGSFIASPGYELIEVDQSQAELRILAALSKDPILCDIFIGGGDLHDDLAAYLFPGWEERCISDPVLAKEQRVKCKNVNFGIIYGITEFGLQGQIGGTIADSRDMLLGWFDRYQVAGKFINKCRSAPANNQIISTCFGRKKRVGIVSRDNLSFLQNEAANFPPQSIASDITVHTAMRTFKPLLRMNVRMVNMVHDSIVMEVPLSKTGDDFIRRRVVQMVTEQLEGIPIEYGITAVPFVADSERGHRWGSLEKYLWREAA